MQVGQARREEEIERNLPIEPIGQEAKGTRGRRAAAVRGLSSRRSTNLSAHRRG